MQTCPDCQGTLEKGCLLDHTYGSTIAQRYAKTEVSNATNQTIMGMAESEFKDIRRVIAYRCTKCNRIFQYAQDSIIIPNLSQVNKKIMTIFYVFAFFIFMFVMMSAYLYSK